jgi:hypothetical protein
MLQKRGVFITISGTSERNAIHTVVEHLLSISFEDIGAHILHNPIIEG